jgi:Uma2 family endonuclease
MATAPKRRPAAVEPPYPTTDGRPMAETDLYADLIIALRLTLRVFFAARTNVYVSGNLLVFYERGNRRRHVWPDVFVVRGVPNHRRVNYLIWEERRSPQVVIEVTSASTRREDQTTKFELYRDVLKVREYFLFDPYGEWLVPPLRGYRLWRGEYRPIEPVNGRLPSRELGLHLDPAPNWLRLWDPPTQAWLPTPMESVVTEQAARRQADAARERAEAEAERERAARRAAEEENARLRRELDQIRRRNGDSR